MYVFYTAGRVAHGRTQTIKGWFFLHQGIEVFWEAGYVMI